MHSVYPEIDRLHHRCCSLGPAPDLLGAGLLIDSLPLRSHCCQRAQTATERHPGPRLELERAATRVAECLEGVCVMATFVLIPGAGGHAAYWNRLVPELETRGHPAIAVDIEENDPSID